MSAPSGKIDEYIARGRQPLTAEQIRSVLQKVPRFLPLPEDVVVLDGIMEVPEGGGYAVGATPRIGGKTVVLSPIADQETFTHELIHSWGLGETAAYSLSPLLNNRLNNAIIPQLRPPREVSISRGPEITEEELRSKLDMMPSGHLYQEMEQFRRYAGLSDLRGIKVYRIVD